MYMYALIIFYIIIIVRFYINITSCLDQPVYCMDTYTVIRMLLCKFTSETYTKVCTRGRIHLVHMAYILISSDIIKCYFFLLHDMDNCRAT